MSASRPSVGFAIVLALLAAAPTAGDVGGCGTAVEPLDALKFFTARLRIECARCDECGLSTTQCRRACDARTAVPRSFPDGCKPVAHDGQVCLRALEALSCSAFEDVVDPAPIVPTECDFCPAEADPR